MFSTIECFYISLKGYGQEIQGQRRENQGNTFFGAKLFDRLKGPCYVTPPPCFPCYSSFLKILHRLTQNGKTKDRKYKFSLSLYLESPIHSFKSLVVAL